MKSSKNKTLAVIGIVAIFIAALVYFSQRTFTYTYQPLLPVDNVVVSSTTTPNTGTVPLSVKNGVTSSTTTSNTGQNATGVTYPNTPINASNWHTMGIAAGSKLIGLSDDALNQELQGIADMGIKWVRFDIEWGFVQYGSPDNYDSNKYEWSRYDRIIKALNAHNLQALPILIFTPEWARAPGCKGGAHCPPQDPNTFAKFAAEAASRYKSLGVHYWEIWNEPNSYDFWATKADCGAYTALLKATYPAIKKADPDAFIITAGLAQISTTDVNISALSFLQCIYKEGGKGYFDAVGDHPYTFPQLPSSNLTNAWARMSLTSPSFRSIMLANGDGDKKIWITEYGTPTNGSDPAWYVSEEKQSKMVSDTINLYKTYDWAGPLFWYTYKDNGTTTDTNENFFGFVRYDNSKKPAYDTLKSFISSI